jgi:hypothetical protein
MVAQGMAVLAWLANSQWGAQAPARRRWRMIGIYAAINIVAIVLFAPWLPVAIRQVTSWSVAAQPYDPGQAMLDSYRWLVVGRTLPLDQAILPLGAVGLLALLGVLFGLRRSERLPTLLLVLLVGVPFVLLFAFHLYREAYLKFLLVCVSPLLILAARGIDVVATGIARLLAKRRDLAWSGTAVAAALGIFILTGPSLSNLYANPAYARDDYRGIAHTIESNARPGDAVLLNAPNQWEVFTYYHRQGAPAIPMAYRPPNDSAVDQQMQPIAAQYTRLFVLYYGESESDPGGGFERWLAQHAFKADEQWIGNIRLGVYATRAPAAAAPVAARFGAGLSLTGAEVDLRSWQDGEVIPLRLAWQADAKLAQRYKVFVHVGPIDAPPVAQNDGEPVAGLRPTDGWTPGQPVIDQRGVWLKPGTPPGRYGIYVGAYDAATGQRLPVQAASALFVADDRLWLGDITVTQAPTTP